MIAYKLLGSVFIIMSVLAFSFRSQKLEKNKVEQTEAFITLLKLVKKQIDCFCLPLQTILKKANIDLLKKCGFSQSNIKNVPLDDPFIWFLSECDLCLDKDAVSLLERFAAELGKTYREEELKSCDYYISELTEYQNKLVEEIPKKQKIRLTVSFCVSISFILLML